MPPRSRAERAARAPRVHNVYVPPPLNQALDDACNKFKTAILPRFPIQELNNQDIVAASEALTVWEKSEEISGKYVSDGSSKNLAGDMLLAMEYILEYPEAPNLDIVPLQKRCNVLQKKIYQILLNEHLDRIGNPDDSTSVSSLIAELENRVLNEGSHELKWYEENFRKMLGLLEALLRIETNSKIVSTLRKIIEVAYIPHFGHLKIVNKILEETNSLDETTRSIYTQRLSNAPNPKTFPEYSRADIQQKISNIQAAAQIRDLPTVITLADYFESLPKTRYEMVAGCIKTGLEQSATAMEKSNILEQQALANRLHSLARKILVLSGEFGVPSTYSSNSKQNIQITFRDISQVNRAAYNKHADCRKYDDLILDAHPAEPIQTLLLRFVEEVNLRNRHPFFPISGFDLTVTKQSTLGSPEMELHVGRNWFTQGTVADALTGCTLISYVRLDGKPNLDEQQPMLRGLWPHQRLYPTSAPPPPAHWIQTPKVAGPWREISSLQFIGNGVELTAYSTYPLLIARTMLIPQNFSTITTSSILLRRPRVSPTLLKEKLTFPLTVDQARSLLGRMVFYQSQDPSELSTGREKRVSHNALKRRKMETEQDPVYMAFVWGLDPDARIIKTVEFSNGASGELCRTFKFDNSEAPLPAFLQPDFHPDDYPPLLKVATFDWIGLVELPTPISTPQQDVEAHREEKERKRKRFAAILAAAPPYFEIGIEADCTLAVGDLAYNAPGRSGTLTVENCKLGIWESGYREIDDDLLIWVQWIKPGTIDLTAPASAFSRPDTEEPTPLPSDITWEDKGWVSTDAATTVIVACGYLKESAMEAITGLKQYDNYLQRLVLSGSEDGRYHIPGGISTYTGGDGIYRVQVSKDVKGNVVAVRVTGDGGVEDEA